MAPIISLKASALWFSQNLSLGFLQPLRSSADTSLYSNPDQRQLCHPKEAKPAQKCQKCKCYCKRALQGQRQQQRRDKTRLEIGFCRIIRLTPKTPELLLQSHCQGTSGSFVTSKQSQEQRWFQGCCEEMMAVKFCKSRFTPTPNGNSNEHPNDNDNMVKGCIKITELF